MSLKKITDVDLTGNTIEELSDIPELSATDLKARFDALGKKVLIPKLNELIGAMSNEVLDDENMLPTGKAIVAFVRELGGGDMLSATYDKNHTGVVDDAEALGGIEAKEYQRCSTNDLETDNKTVVGAINELNKNGGKTFIAEDFDEKKEYSAGKYVVHEKTLYKFIKDKSQGSWDEAVVESVTATNEIRSLMNELKIIELPFVFGEKFKQYGGHIRKQGDRFFGTLHCNTTSNLNTIACNAIIGITWPDKTNMNLTTIGSLQGNPFSLDENEYTMIGTCMVRCNSSYAVGLVCGVYGGDQTEICISRGTTAKLTTFNAVMSIDYSAKVDSIAGGGIVDVNVTKDAIIKALGYTPADQKDMDLALHEHAKIISVVITPSISEIGSTIKPKILVRYDRTPSSITVTSDGKQVFNKTYDESILEEEISLNEDIRSDTKYEILILDNLNHSDQKECTTKFYNGVYYGASSSVQEIQNMSRYLQATVACKFNVDAGANEYIWYACPLKYGDPEFSVGGFDGGFSLYKTVNFTNLNGYTEMYQIWRSDNRNLGKQTVIVK